MIYRYIAKLILVNGETTIIYDGHNKKEMFKAIAKKTHIVAANIVITIS